MVIVSPVLLLRLSPVSQGFLYIINLVPPPPANPNPPPHTEPWKTRVKERGGLDTRRYRGFLNKFCGGKVAVKFHMLSESYRTVSVDDMLLTSLQSFNFDTTV